MYEGGPNPTQVQFAPPAKAANPPLPLVLIHDGGGTTFSYFILGSLSRDVWAIHNPKYFDGLAWEGGMDEMARTYLKFIVDEGLSGPIMLGGWSLGGFLSLTMAHLIAQNPDAYPISIAGLLVIDSPYHIARSKVKEATSKAQLDTLPELVQKAFDNCDIMLQNWDLPQWNGGDGGKTKDMKVTIGGQKFKLQPSQVLYKPSDGDHQTWNTIETKPFERKGEDSTLAAGSPPPAVLIRCTKPAKAKDDTQGLPCLIDLHREERLLGWEGRYASFIKAVIDVDADHYGIFDRMDSERMDRITERLAWGLEVLDGLEVKEKKKVLGVF
ncbi:hypothetical protein QQS21_009579 [Conoideocrella luteorostrata]|uniref:Thioesterase domain-containing protein n=1 Tax=Conoideocrella luteorostrata TaxID=1105319 RepID=A0AAJ0FQ73_9HYPO|nr:hypothetical protein QQS21_009579 [Conoideocrella luteorostrata]